VLVRLVSQVESEALVDVGPSMGSIGDCYDREMLVGSAGRV